MNATNVPAWVNAAPPADEVARLRVPPHSVEAEQSVLGGLLLENASFDRIADRINGADFYRREHRAIFDAIAALCMATKPADVITVHERLVEIEAPDEAFSLAYLNALAASVPSAANIRRYAEIVRERSVLRRLIAVADNAATAAFSTQGRGVEEIVGQFSAELAGLERQQIRHMPQALSAVVVRQLDHYNDLAAGNVAPGMSTGFDALDEALSGGLRAGLYIVAARPSVGKSSFSAQIGLNLARAGQPVLFLSQEMSNRQIADRAMANVAGVPLKGLITGRLSNAEWGRIAEGADKLAAMPFHVDDQPALRLAEIRGKARSIKGLRCVIVDYLQLCSSDLRGETRNAQIGEISRGLKALSKQLEIPVIALSQLSRQVEGRSDKRPTMADLRDSGEIEQDADVIMFLRPVREFAEQHQKILGLEIAKNRDGTTCDQALLFYGPHQHWEESDADLSPPMRSRGKPDEGFA